MGLISKEEKILWKAYLSKNVEKLTLLFEDSEDRNQFLAMDSEESKQQAEVNILKLT